MLDDYLDFAKGYPALFTNPADGGFTIILNQSEIQKVEVETAVRLKAKGLPPEWAKVGIAYRDQYLLLLRDAVRFPDGSLGTYIRFVDISPSVPGVAILPVYQEQILLLRHFRHATRTWHYEIPRGFGIEGTVEANARRELEEEIGASASRLISLGLMYPDTGISSQQVALLFAEVAYYGQVEIAEAITELLPTPVPVFERMIRQNEISDGFTLAAYARAKVYGLL
jgi:ADP-ribose pyrophosphatase